VVLPHTTGREVWDSIFGFNAGTVTTSSSKFPCCDAPQFAAASNLLHAAQSQLHFRRQPGTNAIDDVLIEDSLLLPLADADHTSILSLPDFLNMTSPWQQPFHPWLQSRIVVGTYLERTMKVLLVRSTAHRVLLRRLSSDFRRKRKTADSCWESPAIRRPRFKSRSRVAARYPSRTAGWM